MGTDTVLNAGDLATATSYLYKSAVERFDGVVTDKNGKILAVVGGFKGDISSTAVYPATIMAEAIRIKGAANIWFSHNHPSGQSMLSEADKKLWKSLNTVFKGSGVEPQGLIAVGDQEYSYFGKPEHAPLGALGEERARTPKPKGEFKVPVMERSLAPLKERLLSALSFPSLGKT